MLIQLNKENGNSVKYFVLDKGNKNCQRNLIEREKAQQ